MKRGVGLLSVAAACLGVLGLAATSSQAADKFAGVNLEPTKFGQVTELKDI